MTTHRNSISVFISFANADEPLLHELEKHLSSLEQQGLISIQHRQQIAPGTNWSEAIDEYLSEASLILLLVSSDFLTSDYCYGTEMQQAAKRHERGDACVVPILLRPVDSWQGTWFGKLQVLPSNGVPVISWSNRDEAFADIVQHIRAVLGDIQHLGANIASVQFPRIWNIVSPRNPVFTDREEVLSQIHIQLQTGQAAAISQTHAISGLGGIGKTQIALEYAYQHIQNYQVVLWVSADTRESLVSGYVAIAGLLNLPEKDAQDHAMIVKAVVLWLTTHTEWLLILDNADDLTVVRDFLPSMSGGHLLLTTRAQVASKMARRVEIETMQQDMGALLLLRRASLIGPHASLEDADPSDIAIAREICKDLGGLPLALDQAGAYMEEIPCGLRDYLHLYRTRKTEMLKVRGDLVDDHPESVVTTWLLCFEKVEQKDPMAAELLRFCAFLHPDVIPEEMIIQGAKHLGPLLQSVASDSLLWNKALRVLGSYSLINRNREEKTLTMHRLVQAVLKDTMDMTTQWDWIQRAILVVNEAFPGEVEFTKWSQCERYLPHALACAEFIEQGTLISLESASLLNITGCYLIARGRYSEAEPLLVRALSICEWVLGYEHPDTVVCLSSLAALYLHQQRHSESEALMERALSIQESLLGAGSPDTVQTLSNLAVLRYNQGRYTEVESMLQHILPIDEKVYGAEHPSVATDLSNLGEVYRAQGKYIEAESMHVRAFAIRKQWLGIEHPDTANSLNNLALLYQAQKRYTDAESLYRQALATCERQLGSGHPVIAKCLNNLAELYQSQGMYGKAELCLRQALPIDEKTLGSEHHSVAIDLNNLGLLCHIQGKYMEAESLYRRALAIREQLLGSDHPETAQSLNNLGGIYQIQGKYGEAETLYKRALSIYKQQLGVDHSETATSLNNLAGLYCILGKYTEAEASLRLALEIREQQLGYDHLDTAGSLNNLAEFYREQGKYADAEALYGRALLIWEQHLGYEHPDTVLGLNNLAVLYRKQGKCEQAEPLYQQALAISEKHLGPLHPQTLALRSNYAVLLHTMGRDEEALSLEALDDMQ